MGFLSPTFANAPMDLEGKKPAPPPLYIVGRRIGADPFPWRSPLPPQHLLRSSSAWRSPAGELQAPPPRRRAAGALLNFSSPLLDQEGGDVPGLYVC